MIWILLLAGLTTSVSSMFAGKTTSYQAEDDGVTFAWDGHTRTDMSLASMLCLFQSDPVKVFYDRIDGIEQPQHQHPQFAGRVWCDEDALRDGRFRLRLSGVTAQDSGYYRCDVAANYDKIKMRWGPETTELFLLNVSAHGESSDVLVTTLSPEGAPRGPEGLKKEATPDWTTVLMAFGYVSIILVMSVFLLITVTCLCYQAEKLHLLDQRPLIVSNV